MDSKSLSTPIQYGLSTHRRLNTLTQSLDIASEEQAIKKVAHGATRKHSTIRVHSNPNGLNRVLDLIQHILLNKRNNIYI